MTQSGHFSDNPISFTERRQIKASTLCLSVWFRYPFVRGVDIALGDKFLISAMLIGFDSLWCLSEILKTTRCGGFSRQCVPVAPSRKHGMRVWYFSMAHFRQSHEGIYRLRGISVRLS